MKKETSPQYKIKQVNFVHHTMINNDYLNFVNADKFLIELTNDFIALVNKTTLKRYLVPLSNVNSLELM